MSAPREENATDQYVKQCLLLRLKIAEQKGLLFESTDQFIDHLHNNGGLDDICNEWIRNAPFFALRELLRDHQTRLGRFQPSAAPAVSLNVGGPSIPRFSAVSDSGYDPGSPMGDLRIHSPNSGTDVYFVPTAMPEAEPLSLLARIDTTIDSNIIDLEYAKTLCGDRVAEGQRVLVSYRFEPDDPDGTNTMQIRCVVGTTGAGEANVIFAGEPPGFPRPDNLAGSASGNAAPRKSSTGQADSDQDEFQERYTERMAQLGAAMAKVMAKEDLRNKRRRTEDDDDGSNHPARRTRT